LFLPAIVTDFAPVRNRCAARILSKHLFAPEKKYDIINTDPIAGHDGAGVLFGKAGGVKKRLKRRLRAKTVQYGR
jgi:hypothetical protein